MCALVSGVQTCDLPIYVGARATAPAVAGVCVAHIVLREADVYMLGAYKRVRGRHRPAEARLVVVARHTIGADAALERGNCADRHHFLGVVTRLKISTGMQVLAEPTVGLRCYAKRSAHQAELVDERQAEIDRQSTRLTSSH